MADNLITVKFKLPANEGKFKPQLVRSHIFDNEILIKSILIDLEQTYKLITVKFKIPANEGNSNFD